MVTTLALFLIFVVLCLVNVQIAVSLAVSSIIILAFTTEFNMFMVAQRMFSALDSNTLMAIPGFVFAGALMTGGGISKYLIAAIRSWVGHYHGGLSVVTILACMLFAAISGSSPATAAAIGGILIPALVAGGYNKNYSMGLVAAGGTLGILIPPSISFVLIGVTAELSIGKLFIAGVLPGLFLGGLLIVMAIFVAKKNCYGGEPKYSWKDRWTHTFRAIPGFLMPVIILGSIYGGVATPTESAIIAVFYSLFVALFVYRELTWQGFRHILRESIGITAMIFLIIPAAMTFGLYLTSEKIPQSIFQLVTSYNLSTAMFWFATQTMFFIMGTFLEAVSIILITVPILFPLLKVVGIDPIHFAVIMVVNMELAMITPPVGLNLFVVSGIAKAKLEQVVKGVIPFIIIMIICMILLIIFPKISLLLPGMMKN